MNWGEFMYYIVFDLEWNQCPNKDETKSPLFEIIEIGAVKLNSSLEIISEFNRLVKPQIYNELNSITKEIVNINMNTLQNADTFNIVIDDFFKWCGNNYIFCTWGCVDLTELQKNMHYYNITKYIDKPIIYFDFQKIFSIMTEGKKNQRTLEFAVDMLKIPKTENFHRAIYDARYTAYIIQNLKLDVAKRNCSIDCYINPKTKEEEITLFFEKYSKHISREFNSKEELFNSNDITCVKCPKCKRLTKSLILWFSSGINHYLCLSKCKYHGYIKGKIIVKKTENNKLYSIKIIKLAAQDDIEFINQKKFKIYEKRYIKNHANLP